MIELARSIRIATPPEEVFQYVADYRNVLRFMPYLTDFRPQSRRPYGLGSRFTWEANVRGFPLCASFEVTEFDPPRTMAARTIDGPESACRWTFAPCPEGALVTLETTLVLPSLPLVRLIGRPFFEREIAATMERALRALRECLAPAAALLSR
ncbi:MAG: SRPBCC family protein [Chloroflexota bacterium]|nr:SRPBCC family protein [Dehalococcoidia bacterium]MDW8254193.1 SRPBCC family protein [Chloroflexota bacterium]